MKTDGQLESIDARSVVERKKLAQSAMPGGFDLLGSGQFVSYVSQSNTRSNALAQRLGAARDADAESAFGPTQHVWRYREVQA